ncbi:hypothetical protein [Paenibacillus sp. J2TS4]|uniref:hypothetical protein n=1 Tax=Paenibacillus sp. J2TS4 TaxID=2807194 RepID=UPI001B143589|nr:hypothetical protein [Paenibacillus sp. J2TS4]GIP33039.1 hypothetical protein J2TS4_22490 [Paenibacillus sp. J2TS4]
MNIGHLIRQFVGEARLAEGKALELKPGQIVRGTVLQLLSDQDAVLMISGVKVRAKLETPLQQGESTFLQVLVESAAGQIRLKPVIGGGTPLPEASLLEMLKELGLKDSAANRQLLQWMQQSSVPLTKENAASLAAMAAKVPAGVKAEEWSQAAMLAVKRGLPLTAEHVSALHQALFGKPLHEGLSQLSALLKQSLDAGAALRPELRQQLAHALRAAAAVIGAAAVRLPADAATAVAAAPGQVSTAPQFSSNPATRPVGGEGAGGATPALGGAASAEASARPLAAGQQPSPGPGLPGQASRDPASAAARTATGAASPQAAQAGPEALAQRPAPSAPAAAAQAAEPTALAGRAGTQGQLGQAGLADGRAAASGQAAPPAELPQPAAGGEAAARASEPSWVARLLKAVGLDYEHNLLQQAAKGGPELAAGARPAAAAAPSAPGADPAVAGAVAERAAEASQSLKGALLQLSAADDLPPLLKEAVQQTVQQITGQQLLLAADRSSVFTYVTLSLPLYHAAGEQTAAVHIQSRKSKQGEIDPSNCRLLFDLRMAHLGPTVVDVQVVDRIVNIVVHNNFPNMEEVMEPFRQQMADRLDALGYPFLSIRTVPLPDKTERGSGESGLPSEDGALSFYDTKPYKGVDLRI